MGRSTGCAGRASTVPPALPRSSARSNNGRWRIEAGDPAARVARRYRKRNADPGNDIRDRDGAVTLIDFMAAATKGLDVVRFFDGRSGRVAMRTDLAVRFDYGSARAVGDAA